jgi:endonuclease G
MKKTFLTFALLLACLISFCQPNAIKLVHSNYTSYFDTVKHYPIEVTWWLTKSMVNCVNPVPRVNDFKSDPFLPLETGLTKDYEKSGFDKGHNFPCDYAMCEGAKIESESFYFSNMTPQYHGLNAGTWKTLESECKKLALTYDSIRIYCGSIGEFKKIGKVSVPTQCWKVVYIKKLNLVHCYIFENSGNNIINIRKEIGIFDLEKLTGLKFKFK